MFIETINPSTGNLIKQYPIMSSNEIIYGINLAEDAWQKWKKTDFNHRSEKMKEAAYLLRKNKQDYALLMASEMGKPINAGEAEIEKCAWVCEHYALHAQDYLAPRIIKTEMQKSMVCYQPLGIVFAIMPWNFPFWQVFRFAAPTLMAGNAGILKHAPISSGTGNAIAELFANAGFPSHLFQHFILDNDKASEVIANEKIVAVTLTGSERAGSSIAQQAGKYLKKSVLELGGSDPYLILEDADLDLAANQVVASRLNNSGQVCIAAKRILAVKSIVDELLQKIGKLMENYQPGDPLSTKTTMGPMARRDLRDTLHRQVSESIARGAILHRGGIVPQGEGNFYPATLLSGVKPGMPAFEEELFGPVVTVIEVEDEREAIALANQSRYGLGAAVFTRDLERGERIATVEIESGTCCVNTLVASDPRLPFGGIKRSGFGRELSQEGIREFVNTKTISIR